MMTLTLAISLAICGLSPAADAPGPAQPATQPVPVPRIDERLAALSPERPIDYFLLAEEVAAEVQDRDGRDLARRLYVLAFELDRKSAKPANLGPSVCLGLVPLAGPQGEKRWLRALALRLQPAPAAAEGAGTPAPRPEAKEVSSQVALQLATALGYVRSGEGGRARRLLARAGVREVLESYEEVLAGRGEVNPIQRIERYIDQWSPSCKECGGRHVISRGTGSSQSTILCPTCGGLPGPKLTEAELLGHLRMESALLRGIHRLWSAQLLADDAQPLRDPEPDDLSLTYRIDTDASVYRNGKWVKPETRPGETKPSEAKPKEVKPADAAPSGKGGG